MFFTQRSLIYYPQPRSNRDGVPIMTLHTDAGPVLVSTRPASGPEAVIYFGGNAEDVSLDLSDFSSAFPNDAIYLLHYRGYGGSAGKPSEKALFADALMLFDEVHAQHPNIVLVGRSLGTGIAVKTASERPITRLVLITPYDSLTDAAAQAYPWLPVRLLIRDKYDSWKYAPQVTAPTRIIAAGNDEIIPRSSTERLRTRFKPGIATYVVIPGVGHNTISHSADYLRQIANP
jgi:pimeloyl-ACP methyl ester carboxylesterase